MEMPPPLTMFVIVRKDLQKSLDWPLGAVMAQACHAATACMWHHREHPAMLEYTKDLSSMCKVVLSVDQLSSLERVEREVKEGGWECVRWTERPENLFTALATIPVAKETTDAAIFALLKKRCQLYK